MALWIQVDGTETEVILSKGSSFDKSNLRDITVMAINTVNTLNILGDVLIVSKEEFN